MINSSPRNFEKTKQKKNRRKPIILLVKFKHLHLFQAAFSQWPLRWQFNNFWNPTICKPRRMSLIDWKNLCQYSIDTRTVNKKKHGNIPGNSRNTLKNSSASVRLQESNQKVIGLFDILSTKFIQQISKQTNNYFMVNCRFSLVLPVGVVAFNNYSLPSSSLQ